METAFRETKNTDQLPGWPNHRSPVEARWGQQSTNSWTVPQGVVERLRYTDKVAENALQTAYIYQERPNRIPWELRPEKPAPLVERGGWDFEKALPKSKPPFDEAHHETEGTRENWEEIGVPE